MSSKLNYTKPYYPIMLLMIGYWLIAIYFIIFLQYDFLKSDVLSYWQDSLKWQTPFNLYHVPLYPLIIAILNGITFGVFHPIFLMMSINLAAFLSSTLFIYKIIQRGGASVKIAALSSLFFGLWPFIGLTYTVNPLADIPAMFFLLAGLLLLQRSCRLTAAMFLGLSLVTHKAMWVFVGLLVLSEIFHCKQYFSKKNLLFIGIIFLPIGILWISGAFYYNSNTWLFSGISNGIIASNIIGDLSETLKQAGIKDLIKGILLFGIAVISAFSISISVRLKYQYYHYGIIISLAVILLFLIIDTNAIWAVMRFGRLLVIPLAFIINAKQLFNNKSCGTTPVIISIIIMLLLSQFAYAWYWGCIYYK